MLPEIAPHQIPTTFATAPTDAGWGLIERAMKEWLRIWRHRAPSLQATLIDDGGCVVRARDVELHLWEQLEEPPPSDDHRIYLFKDRRFLSALVTVLDPLSPKHMVEIGIHHGGSTIYWAERYCVERLVAIELAPAAPFLRRYLERHDLTDRVRVHFGVSQADAVAVRAAVTEGLAGAAADAIVDDASHQFRETRTTVETLLPYVRPGGAYVIEDWAWGHHKNWRSDIWPDQALMSPLLSELMLICGSGKGVIDQIDVDQNFAVLWRGFMTLPKDGSFRLVDHYVARGFTLSL